MKFNLAHNSDASSVATEGDASGGGGGDDGGKEDS